MVPKLSCFIGVQTADLLLAFLEGKGLKYHTVVLCNFHFLRILFNFWIIPQNSDQAERAALIQELAALRQKKDQLKAEIDKYKECDPDVVEDIRKLYSELLWQLFDFEVKIDIL